MKPEEAVAQMVVQFGWTQVWAGVALAGVLQFLFVLLLRTRLENSVRHQYDRLLIDYQRQVRIREQASRVAELLAHRYSSNIDPEKFNRLAWELSLWLPAPLVCDLTRCLVADANAKTPKEILIEVRKVLLENPKDPLIAENLVHIEDPKSTAALTAALTKNPEIRNLG
jgi:hypothetical protein